MDSSSTNSTTVSQPLAVVSILLALVSFMMAGYYGKEAMAFTSRAKRNIVQSGSVLLSVVALGLLCVFDSLSRAPTLYALAASTPPIADSQYTPFPFGLTNGIIMQHFWSAVIMTATTAGIVMRLQSVHARFETQWVQRALLAYTAYQVVQCACYASLAGSTNDTMYTVSTYLFVMALVNIGALSYAQSHLWQIRVAEGKLFSEHDTQLIIYAFVAWSLLQLGDMLVVVSMLVPWAASNQLMQAGQLQPVAETIRLVSRIVWVASQMAMVMQQVTRQWRQPVVDESMEVWVDLTGPHRRPKFGNGEVA